MNADTPAPAAAIHVLSEYLSNVRRNAEFAKESAEADIEFVHQLRVGIRRTMAVVKVFKKQLNKDDAKRIKDCLSDLRRSAGDARDLDVLIEDLTDLREECTPSEQKTIDFLLEHHREKRQAAQPALSKAIATVNESDFWPWCDNHIFAETFDPEAEAESERLSLGELAKKALTKELNRFYDQHAKSQGAGWDELHQTRIEGKKLRYAMEIFADCLESTKQKELYAPMKEIQDILGQINDDHTFVGLFESELEQVPPDNQELSENLQTFIRRYKQRMEDHRRLFEETWEAKLGESYRENFLAAL